MEVTTVVTAEPITAGKELFEAGKRAFIGQRNDRMSGAARTFHKIVGNIGWGLICHDISLTAQIREPTR